jgi:hypothetical protein
MARRRSKLSTRQKLAATRKRDAMGRFMPIEKSASTATLESVMSPASATAAPTVVSAENTQQTTDQPKEIGLLESIGIRRKEMGFETSELDKYVVGMEGQKGVRSTVEDYISQNRSRFLGQDPAAAAARELMDEATQLSEQSIGASYDEAKRIYAKIKFIRELAKKTQGEQSDIAAKLDEIVAPVEEQLKKRTSFQEFIKEKAQSFRKTLPERLASKIPVVGGILGEFLKQRRETQEELERYSGGLQRSIARRGKRNADIDIYAGGRIPRQMSGGTRASDIPGLISGREDTTLGSIYKEISEIRKLLVEQFKPQTKELSDREAELESLGIKPTPASEKPQKSGGLLSGLAKLLGFGKQDGESGILGNLMSMLTETGLAGTGRGILSGAKKLGGKALGAIGSLGSKAFGLIKDTPLVRDAKSIGGMIGKAGGKVVGAAKTVGSSVASATKGMGTSIASTAGKAGGWLSRAWGSVSGAVSNLSPAKAIGSAVKSSSGKILKAIVSIPGLGALITAGMGAIDLASIKNDAEMSPDEKKEKLGVGLVKVLGSVLGSVGGGILGSMIPIPGIGTLVGTLGGEWVGSNIAEYLGEAVGGRKIYDMVSSIPGIGSLIDVGGAEQQKNEKAAEGAAAGIASASTVSTSQGEQGQNQSSVVEGKISAPASPNTSLGKMVQQYNNEMNALDAEKAAAVGTAKPAAPSVNSVVQTKINNTTNNFNDDLRLRNSEPTILTMQRASHSF